MIIGAVLGLVGSVVPELIKVWRDREDKKHEKEMFKLQMEYQREMTELKVQEARAMTMLELDKKVYEYAEPQVKPTGFKLADTLMVVGQFYNTTVRPTLTYLVIACWIGVKVAMWKLAGGGLEGAVKVWTEADSEFVSAVIMFWFGGRAFSRTFGRVNK